MILPRCQGEEMQTENGSLGQQKKVSISISTRVAESYSLAPSTGEQACELCVPRK